MKARYSYLADGTKLRVRDNGEVNGFDYTGSLTYRKSSAGLQLESANFGSGVIRVTGSTGNQQEVNYFLTDHLGSVRVIIDGNGVVKERNDYYPFGARHVRSDYAQRDGNRFKYNGKEELVTGDLDFLDYGARMYDSGLGRWFSMDPLAGAFYSVTPYCYTLNSPLNLVDPNGAWVVVPTRSQLFVMSEPGDDYNSLMTFFGSESNALYYLSQSLLDLVKKGDASFYLLAFNETNNLSVAWTDVYKNPKKYGRRKDEEEVQNKHPDYEMKISMDRYSALIAVSEDSHNYNYNCHSAALNGSLHQALDRYGNMSADDRDDIIRRDYVNISREQAIFGRTIITFGSSHDALFLGKSRDGIITVFTKNGAYFAPKIMELNKLEKERSYGNVRDIGVDVGFGSGTGFYNPKKK